ncbi:hypothetical protein Q767_13075 [Flavobacterium enshiense DK69]|uniref:Fibronectin type-III domain-containing protein n=2 Tax=Flavobacterium TaxID=237 RepID=A0A0A2MQ82_9FLAO|nr:hypothetical protein Q767_13075 [Flavobacterium enshiense DK69]
MKKYLLFKVLFAFVFLGFQADVKAQFVSLDISGNYKINGTGGIWWDYQYKPTGSSTYTQSAIIQNNSASLVRLNPFVSWDFRIRFYGYTGQPGLWGSDYTVNSEYAAISKLTGYSFNFDTSPIVEGWRGYRLQNTTSNTNSNIEEATYLVNGTSGKSLFMGWRSGNGVMLVSPKITDLATDKKFSIYANSYQGSYSVVLGTIGDPYDPATFHPLKTVTLTGGGFNKINVFFNNYVGSDQYIAIKSSGNYGDVYFDDFSYEQSVNCFDNTNLTVSDVTESTAKINFTADALQNNWELELKNVTYGITETMMIGTNVDYQLQNLTGNTNYQVKVRANCGEGLYSNWTPTQSFTTSCSIIAAGYQTSFLEKNYFNPCWSRIEVGANVYQAPIGGNTSIIPRTGSKYIQMINSSVSSANKSYLITPYITDLANNKRVKFFLVAKGNSDYITSSLIIGTMSNPSDETTFVPLKTISPLEMNEINGFEVNDFWKEHIVYLDNYNNALDHHYIAIKQNNIQDGSTFHIDDFTYEVIPSCKEPVNLKMVKSTYETAILSWENNNTPSNGSWQIEYGPSGFTLGTGVTINASTTTATLTNLLPFTNYEFYVRSQCGSGFSNWSDRGVFKTKCEGVTAGYTYDFENGNFDSNCWARITPKIRDDFYSADAFIYYTQPYGSTPTTPHSGTKMISIMSSNSSPDNYENEKTILVPPRLIGLNNERKISFWAYVPSSVYNSLTNIQVGTLSDPEDYQTFVPFENITTGFQLDAWKKYEVDFSGYYGSNKFIGIRIFTYDGDNYIVYLDDFAYENHNCAKPTNLSALQSGADSVTLNWNINNNNPVHCEVEYGPLGFTPGTGTAVTVTSLPLTITNLSPNTKYQFRVRNICDSNVVNWSNLYSFKISCMVSAPFEDKFDQYPATNAYLIPNFCWTVYESTSPNQISNFSGVRQYSFNNFNSSPNSAQLICNDVSSNTPNIVANTAYFISPFLSDFDSTKRIKFWTKSLRIKSGEYVSVGVLSNPLDLSTFVSYQNIYFDNETPYGKEVNIDFTNYTGNGKYIAFKFVDSEIGISSKAVYFDDFKYLSRQNCMEPVNIEFLNLSNDSVLLKWNNTNGENVKIEYGPTGFLPGTGLVAYSTTNQSLVEGLSQNTAYDFYFKTLCGSGESIIVGPKKITTTCNIYALPWVENFSNMTAYGNNLLPDCFKMLYGNFSAKNAPQTVNGYNYDHIINGVGDSTYLHFIDNFSTKIHTPMFNLIAGTTYKFSLFARCSYQYGPGAIYASIGRGQEEHYMEANLQTVGSLTEYNYSPFNFYFTPVESGDYSYLVNFMGSSSINMIADKFQLEEGYENLITASSEVFDFQSGVSNKLILESTLQSKILNSGEPGNSANKLLIMNGSTDSSSWMAKGDVLRNNESTSGDVWKNNVNNITKVNMKVASGSVVGNLYLRFNLKQTFNNSNNESMFRVLVNGNVLETIRPTTSNQDAFVTYEYDLTPYLGNDLRISLQHIGKSSGGTIGDKAFLDNIVFSPSSLLSNEEVVWSNLKVYPNPTKNQITVSNSEILSKIEIINITGQVLFSNKPNQSEVKLDLSDYPVSVYFVRVTSDNKSAIIKIVKN